jgi:hypothetical protein
MKKFSLIMLLLLFPAILFGCSSSDNSSEADSYLGTWMIDSMTANAPMGDFGNTPLTDIIGKKLTFSKTSCSCFGDSVDTLGTNVENPKYVEIDMPKEDFERLTSITFESLNITGDTIKQISVVKDPDRNTGIVFYFIDKDRIIANSAGTFFLLKRQ